MLLNTILDCYITSNSNILIFEKNCENVFRIFFNTFEIINTLDRLEAEYLFDLANNGYNFYKSFGKEKI